MNRIFEKLTSVHWLDRALDLIGQVALGAALFVVGVWLSRRLANFFKRSLDRAEVDPLLTGFLRNLMHGVLCVLLLVAALDVAGLPTASLLAALGAAGLAIGLALQGSLSNLASGVLLILFRPFEVGQQIEVLGMTGTVERIGLMHTILLSPDNRVITIPNAKLASDAIVNNTAREQRRVDMTVQVAYRDSIDEAIALVRATLARDARVLAEPKAEISVLALSDTGVTLAARPWVKTPDYNAARSELLLAIKTTLNQHGMTLPVPQRELRLVKEEIPK